MIGTVVLPPAAKLSTVAGREVALHNLLVGALVRGYDMKQVRPAVAKITAIDPIDVLQPGMTLYVQNLPTLILCAATKTYSKTGIVPAQQRPSALASPCGFNPRTILLREVMQYRDTDDLIPAVTLRWEGDCDFLLVESLLCGSTDTDNG